MESERDISDPNIQTLDHRFRSLTCLGEILYNEGLHDTIPAQDPGYQTDHHHAFHIKGRILGLQISRVLVRQPGENVTFAVMMSKGGVEKAVVTTEISTALLNRNDGLLRHDNPKSDEIIKYNEDTNSPLPGRGDPLCEGLELHGHPSSDDVIDYIVTHFQSMAVGQKSDKIEDIISFDAHVRNTLKLLVNCSTRDQSASVDANTALLTYTACMGIEKWKSRYTVNPIVRDRYSQDDIPFDSFLQLEDPVPWIVQRLVDWPKKRIIGKEKETLLKFLSDFAAVFDTPYGYIEFLGDGGAASQHREARKKIAHVYLDAAMKAVEEGFLDENVARFYHVTLGQALKDAQDWSTKVISVLRSPTSPTDGVSEIIFHYVQAIHNLRYGVFEIDFLLAQYKQALRECLGRKAPRVPMLLWPVVPAPSTLVTQHSAFESEEFDLFDDSETGDDEDYSIAAKTSLEPKAWTVAYFIWLRNTVKSHRAVRKLIAFARSRSHGRIIIEAIRTKIEAHLCSPSSSKMEDWKEMIHDLFPDEPGQATNGKADNLIRELDCVATMSPDRGSELSFHSLNSRWSSSFNGTRHGQSQFAIEYSRKVRY